MQIETIKIFGVMTLIIATVFTLSRVKSTRHSELIRKASHMTSGILCAFFPIIFAERFSAILICFAFLGLFMITRLLKPIAHIQNQKRLSFGELLFPVGVLIALLLSWHNPVVYTISVLILAIADALAALVGQKYGKNIYKVFNQNKSIEGSLIFFIAAATIIAGGLSLTSLPLLNILLISIVLGYVLTAAEALSVVGTDNLIIPLLSTIYLQVAMNWSQEFLLIQFFALSSAIAIGYVLYKKNSLDVSGAFAFQLIAFTTIVFGGVNLFLAMMLPYLVINKVDRLKSKHKSFKSITEHSGSRNFIQIFVNTIICAVFVLLYFVEANELFILAFLGAFSAACADTMASEIGKMSKQKPFSILSFKKIPTGQSGGVTLLGYIGAFAGSLMPVTVYLALTPLDQVSNPFLYLIVGASAGMVGTTVDSIVGCKAQRLNYCHQCQSITEKSQHCTTPTQLIKGSNYITNDTVNFIANISGTIAALIIGVNIL